MKGVFDDSASFGVGIDESGFARASDEIFVFLWDSHKVFESG